MRYNAAGTFLRRDDEFLFHLRDDIEGIDDPGMWSIIGGHLEDGESPEQCARREALEEIGVELGSLRYLGTIDGSRRIALFISDIDIGIEDIELKEGQRVCYFTLERIMHENLVASLKRFIFLHRELLL